MNAFTIKDLENLSGIKAHTIRIWEQRYNFLKPQRTATNIRAGAQTPFAGMFHALFVLVFMLGLGPLIARVPLASLAAVLAVVAWNMSERDRFGQLLNGLAGDRVVLLATFLLTVMVDLTLAIEVGVVLAAIIFMHRMAEANKAFAHYKW